MEPKKKEFPPKWKFHKTKPMQLVKSAEHEKFLGKDWTDSPADHGVITHPLSDEQEAAQAAHGLEKEEFEPEEAELEVKPPKPPKKGKQKE